MSGLIFFVTIWVLIYMTFWWALASLRKNNSFADVAWGTIFILIGSLLLSRLDYVPLTFFVVFILILIWGARLALHIGLRNLTKPEDRRYAEWRAKGGKNYMLKSLPRVFWLQGVIALVISAPLFIAAKYGNDTLSLLSLLGVLIWIFGFSYESTADRQLKEFLKTKKPGQIMNKGLWEFSRHPNYFGEICQWVGLFMIVAGLKYGLIAIVSPILIAYLLKYVSGVPLAEKNFKDNKEFKEYARKTSPIFPHFFKRVV